MQVVDPHEGTNSIRLFHEEQLAPLLDTPLTPGHEVLDLATVTLPTLNRASYSDIHTYSPHPDAPSPGDKGPGGQVPGGEGPGDKVPGGRFPGGDFSGGDFSGGKWTEGDRGNVVSGQEYLCLASVLAARADQGEVVHTMPLLSIFQVASHRVPDTPATRFAFHPSTATLFFLFFLLFNLSVFICVSSVRDAAALHVSGRVAPGTRYAGHAVRLLSLHCYPVSPVHLFTWFDMCFTCL